ncbi:MAG: protein phosphatase 2C domain-containing protein [Microcella pacifica]
MVLVVAERPTRVSPVSSHVLELSGAEVRLSVAAVSDRGRVRHVNEDSYWAHPPVFLVADGMGGHRFGDRASAATARTFADGIPADEPTTTAAVLACVQQSHARVRLLAGEEQAGTTLSGVALVHEPGDARLYWMAFNIGDSRVYSWSSADGLAQISVDHSAVQELIDEGSITREEAESHPERNVITRAVGSGSELDPDVWLMPAGDEQCFLICSDGLTKELTDGHISQVMASFDGNSAAAAMDLVGAALQSGAADNVTVVIVAGTTTSHSDSATDEPAMAEHLETTLPREERA